MCFDIRVIHDRVEFAGLADAWNDLVDRSTLNSRFYRHEWFQCWLEHLSPPSRLCIVILARQGRLVAAAPLHIVNQRRRGLPIKQLTFLQSGITPRSGFLVENEDLCESLLTAIDALEGWDLAEFKSMELEHSTTRRIVEVLRRRGMLVAEAGMTSPYEELPASWDEYYQLRTNKLRQRFRSAHNRIHKQASVEVLRMETFSELAPHFHNLLAISAASWKGAEGSDMATVSQTAAFYESYSKLTDGQAAWIVYMLRLDGKPVAFMYLLRDRSHWVALRSDYDEEFSYYMPGVYLHKEVIGDLVVLPPPRIYDLVGWATPFKSGLASSGRSLCDLTLGARHLKGNAMMVAKNLLGKRASARYLDLDQVILGTVPPFNADDGSEPARES